jgi:glycosyltransferase involved in cell wall biosynthesis
VDLVQATPGDDFRSLVPAGVRLVDLNAHRVLASLPALVHYLRRERPAAVLSGADHANVAAIWAKRLSGVRTRLVISVHNSVSGVTRNAPTWRGRRAHHFIRRFYPWADGIVAVSQGVAEDLAKVGRLPRERIRVIYNPVITPQMFAAAKEAVSDGWFAPGQAPVILAAGRLTAAKDFPNLLHAFCLLRREMAARLVILGVGEELARLQALTEELGVADQVRFPGFSSNPYAYMARAAVFVLSSAWGEGLPTVLLESMALGTPVVSTDCPEGPRELLRGGELGALVPVRDPASLAQAITRSLRGGGPKVTRDRLRDFELDAAAEAYLEELGQH